MKRAHSAINCFGKRLPTNIGIISPGEEDRFYLPPEILTILDTGAITVEIFQTGAVLIKLEVPDEVWFNIDTTYFETAHGAAAEYTKRFDLGNVDLYVFRENWYKRFWLPKLGLEEN